MVADQEVRDVVAFETADDLDAEVDGQQQDS